MLKQICRAIALLIFTGVLSHAGMIISPTRQEMTLMPGGSAMGIIRVTNDFGKPTDMSVETRYWYVSKDEERTTKVTDWLTVTPSTFTFDAGETRNIKYSVKLSTGLTGMRAAMITFVPASEGSNVTLVVSVSLYVTVAGTEKVAWDFSNFEIRNNEGSTQLSVIANNSGNVHVRPSGSVRVIRGRKKEVKLDILEGNPVYPDQTRQMIATGPTAQLFPKRGKYKIIFTLNNKGDMKTKTYNVVVEKNGVITIK